MILNLSPRREAAALSVARSGDVLTINGQSYDFSELPDGATIPEGVVPCDRITGPVHRVDGDIHLTLILPHGANPPHAVAFPVPIVDPADGPITLPGA